MEATPRLTRLQPLAVVAERAMAAPPALAALAVVAPTLFTATGLLAPQGKVLQAAAVAHGGRVASSTLAVAVEPANQVKRLPQGLHLGQAATALHRQSLGHQPPTQAAVVAVSI